MTAFGKRSGAPAPAVLRSVEAKPAETARRLVDWLLDGLERRRQRRLLLALDERMLRDVGISRADALREGGKPFWQA
jgi:uncharacterized protein YjiS (DUF1127 family)